MPGSNPPRAIGTTSGDTSATDQVLQRTTRAAAGATPAFVTRVSTNYGSTDLIESWQDQDSSEVAAVDGIGRFRAGIFDDTVGVPAYGMQNEVGLGWSRGAAGQLVGTDASTQFARLSATLARFTGQLELTGDITPTALGGNVNDYAPTGLAGAFVIRQGGGAADRTITGLTGGSDGRVLLLVNIGATNTLILPNASGSSASANQFATSGAANVVIPVAGAALLYYDSTATKWRAWLLQ